MESRRDNQRRDNQRGGRFARKPEGRRPEGNRFGGGMRGGDRGAERFDKRERFMKRSRESVMEALKSRDMLLSSATRSIEDLDETINLLAERFEDWYGIYFPELKADDKLSFCKAALIIVKETIDEAALAAVIGQRRATDLKAAAPKSLGATLSPKDHSECLSLARMIISMEELRKTYEAYQKELANEIVPNMSEVGGPEIAAKLVSHVGSLKRLAVLPASAVQVLGAEKALFKHLRNKNIPSPKHGIIFQHPKISSSPKAVRGKIARALANKLATAAKADAFSKRRISAELRKDFDTRFSEIMAEYERAKAKKAASAPAPPPPRS